MATYRLRQLLYASEVAFASTAMNPSTLTWDQMIPAENIVLRTDQSRIRDLGSRGRENEFGLSHLGARECELEFTTRWIGNLADPGSSTLTERWNATLLGYAIGGKRTAGSGTTISGTSSTVSNVYVATAAGFSVGDFCAIGTKGDGRGDGQMYRVSAISATSGLLILATETPAAPTTSGDTVSRVAALYRDETATLTTVRFGCLYSDANAQFVVLGAQLAGFQVAWDLSGRELPQATWRYRAAYWDQSAITFPYTSLTVLDNWTRASTGGSFFLNTVGTGTRATKTPATYTVAFETDVLPTYGPGGNGDFQSVTAWTRSMWSPTITVQIPFETAQMTKFDTVNASYSRDHSLLTACTTGGFRTGGYAPRMFLEGNRPISVIEVNGLNYITVQWLCTDGTDTTTALSRTPYVLLCG